MRQTSGRPAGGVKLGLSMGILGLGGERIELPSATRS
jgi:hypothetical protein